MSSNNLSLSNDHVESHPLDVVEEYIDTYNLDFHRRSENEIVFQLPGAWCDYSLLFAWSEEVPAIHFSCAFDMRVKPVRRSHVNELLALINEKSWCGHFCVCPEEGLPMFRHAMPMRGTDGPTYSQVEDIIDVAMTECERFYPTFQYVIWGDKDATEAVAAAMIDTVGEC